MVKRFHYHALINAFFFLFFYFISYNALILGVE